MARKKEDSILVKRISDDLDHDILYSEMCLAWECFSIGVREAREPQWQEYLAARDKYIDYVQLMKAKELPLQ